MTWYKKREKKDMFEELKEMICEYVDVEPEKSGRIPVLWRTWALIPMIL